MRSHENGILLYNELQGSIGSAAALRVFELLQGQQVYFPSYVSQLHRNRAILEDFRAGMSYRKLALKYHLTPKHIRNITAPKNRKPTHRDSAAPQSEANKSQTQKRESGFLF